MRKPDPETEAKWRADLDRLLESKPLRTDEPPHVHCPGDPEHISGPLGAVLRQLRSGKGVKL